MESSLSPVRKKMRTALIKVITMMLPVLLIGLIELCLVGFDYGYDLSVFVEDGKHPDSWILNPHVSKRYFIEDEIATVGNEEPFKKEKSEQTCRIFVLGESTTVGYPYFHNGSFHRWLQFRLMHSYPNVNFEIINLSLTAVNSYTVRDFALEITDYQPDAVLIYVGHNEYYGAQGVGSSNYIGQHPRLVRFVLWLRKFRIVQAIHALKAKMSSLSGDANQTRETLMKRMAADQKIPLGSEKYEQGVQQFEANMRNALEHLQKNKVPVFISSLFSNEKDLKPFISDTISGNSAQASFQKAEEYLSKGDYRQAKEKFVEAKELDLLRFRAPGAINEVIEKMAAEYSVITLVDTKRVLENNSPNRILGRETLLEHVHPNLWGYALMSDAFFQSIMNHKIVPYETDGIMSLDSLWKSMPITALDSLRGLYEVMILKEQWPFNEPMPEDTSKVKSMEERLAGAVVVQQMAWGEAMRNLLEYYYQKGDHKKAAVVLEAFALEYPFDPTVYRNTGNMYERLGMHEKAVFYWKHAFSLDQSPGEAQKIFVALLKLDKAEESIPYLDYVVINGSSGMELSELRNIVGNIVMLQQQYFRNNDDILLSNQIANLYLKFANKEAALKYIHRSEQIDPTNSDLMEIKKRFDEI